MASDDPPEKDMKEFEFVQLCKFRVSESDFTPSLERSQMLTCSSTYGLIIYATKTGFNVVKTSDLLSIDESIGLQRNKVTIEDIPVHAKILLPSPAHFLALSGDGAMLVVVCKSADQTNIVFFDVHGFADKNTTPQPFTKLSLNLSPGVSVVDVAWNPALFSILAVCFSNGAMSLVNVKDNAHIVASLPSNIGSSCFSWSPKGKQLLVGKQDGSLCQYDHTLAEKKKWACPSVFSEPQRVVDVVWLSTYTFIAAYLGVGAQDSDQPIVVMTNSNKENNTSYINFDDVCFSSSEDRKPQYLFHIIQKWEVVLMASSRATEVTVVGKNLDNKTSWERWNLEDSSRAELPLTGDHCDSFPLGIAVDYSPQKPVVLSETKTFPACPVMFLLSTDGLLLIYHLHYSHKDAPPVTAPSHALNLAQAKKGLPGLLDKATPTPSVASHQPPPPSATVKPSPFSAATISAATGSSAGVLTASGTSAATEAGKNVFNVFGAPASSSSSGINNPTASSMSAFQFGKTDATAAVTTMASSSSASQRPGLLSTPNVSQSSQGQGHPISPSFGFSFGAGAGKPAQSSAFATIPPSSQQAAPSSTLTGFNFGQNPSIPTFDSSTPASKTGTPFLAPNMTPTRQVTPPNQQATPPSSKPASTSSIFSLKPQDQQPKLEGVAKPQQQHQQQPPLLQRPTSAVFGGSNNNPAVTKSTTSLSINRQPSNGGFVSGQNVMAAATVQTTVSGGLTPQTKGTPESQLRAAEVTSASPSIEATVDGAFSQNIAEEIAHFEEEMKKFRHCSKRDIKTVGTRAEMQCLRKDTEESVIFLSEIKEVVKDQLNEVQDLKSNCLNLSADVEKSNTQLQRNADPHYRSLLQGRALDPASAKQLQDIQQMAQVLEQMLGEVNHTLDSQWEQHLAHKSQQGRLSIPTGDTIYKSIKNNHQIISYQKRNLDKLEEKMSNLRLGWKDAKKDRSSVFSLVAEDSPRSLGKQEFSPSSGKPLSLKEAVSQGMTPEKVSRLKEILSQRKVPLVKSKTPTNLSMSRIVASTPRRPETTSLSSASSQISKALTPSATNLPQQQNESQTPNLQHQQQKSLYGNPAMVPATYQNTPSGIPTTELRLPKGPLPNPESTTKPAAHDFRFSPQNSVNSATKASMFAGTGGSSISGSGGVIVQHGGGLNFQQQQQQSQPQQQQKPQMVAGPTSFSGVAYFKQPMTTPPPSTAMGLSPPQLQQHHQQLPADLQAATQVLNKHLASVRGGGGGLFNLPAMFATAQDGSVGVGGQGQIVLGQQQQQQQQYQPAYEDITPTETDETNDDEDDEDYEEEDNGYEDEVEEEYEEEDYVDIGGGGFSISMGAAGVGKSFFPVKTTPVPKVGDGSSNPTPLPPPSSFPGSGSLFGGGGDKPSSTSVSANVTTTAAGFAFSGTAFGQKAPPTASSSLTGNASASSIFGGSGLSRSVGFSDLVKGNDDVKTTGSSSSVIGGQTSPRSKFGFGTTPSSPTSTGAVTSPGLTKATPTSSSAAGFSFLTAASGNTSTSSSVEGGSLFGSGKTAPSTASPNSGGAEVQKASPSDKPKSPTSDSSKQAAAATSAASPSSPQTTTSAVQGETPSFVGAGSNTTASPSAIVGGSSGGIAPFPTVTGSAVTTTVLPGPSGVGVSKVTATSSAVPSFGGANASTAASLFGGGGDGAATTSATSSIFGSGGTAAATTTSIATATTATIPSFGGLAGSAVPATLTSKTSPFGGATSLSSSLSQPTSLFGGNSTATTSATNLFGTNNTTPIFGAGGGSFAATSTSSIFGNSAAATTKDSSSSSTPSLFGSSSATTTNDNKTDTLFGSSSAATTSTPASSGLFGQTQTGTTSPFFGGAGASSTNATTSSIFGKAGGDNAGSSTFSFNTQPSATESSTFGSGSFGGGAAPTSASSGFSMKPTPSTASDNGSSVGGNASSLFGGFAGLGAKPSEEKANTNVFGTPQTFGSPTTQNSLFGTSSSSPFGGSTFGGGTGTTNAFGSGGGGSGVSAGAGAGNFSGANAGVSSTGFGVNNTSSSVSGGFGSSPAFGSSPNFGGNVSAFGSPSVFGGGATFGSASTFGSAGGAGAGSNGGGGGGVFGSAGGNSSSSGGFGSFAASSAPTFGQLAQSSPSGFGNAGNSAPTAAFGGGAQSSPFGGAGTGTNAFGGAPAFGQQPTPGGGGGFGSPQAGFGGNQSSGFGSSPAFSSYRG